ncbi:type II toxin-antitoxin system RelE/ParE family toxin [Paraburkholderia phenazinium]|uniref:type II toxin-antitoxin system RelE/ParE family toxin n=1 Tax=Paraburkholderia phenazinium TaxID=60549 RepID=UPI003CC60982
MDHIAEDSPAAALAVDEEIESQADTLVQHPQLGRHGRVSGTRELVIARTPYIAVYAIDRRTSGIEMPARAAHRTAMAPCLG